MSDKEFWQLIAAARSGQPEEDTLPRQLQRLEEELAARPRESLIGFELTLRAQLRRLYHARVLELYTLLCSDYREENGEMIFDPFVSDDGFLYFRCWLLLHGAAVANAALRNPEDILNHPLDLAALWSYRGENLLYVADEAQARQLPSGSEPDIRITAARREPELDYDFGRHVLHGGAPNREGLGRRYPKLAALARARKVH